MNARKNRTRRCAALLIAAVMLIIPVTAMADVSLDDGAITFGGDATTTNYSQDTVTNEPYTGTATVTGDYSGPDTAITVSGGEHTIVVDGASFTPGATDSADPVISIEGGKQDITLTDTFINAGENGPGMVINGGEHEITMDDFAINGSGDAGIAIEGDATVNIDVQGNSSVIMGDATAMSVTEGSDVTVTGDATLKLSSESAGGALAGDSSGSLTVPVDSGATVELQVNGKQAHAQGVTINDPGNKVHEITGTTDIINQNGATDNPNQTGTTNNGTSDASTESSNSNSDRRYGFTFRVEYLGDSRFLINSNVAPISIEIDGKIMEFTFDNGVITVLNMPAGASSMVIKWPNAQVGIGFGKPLY